MHTLGGGSSTACHRRLIHICLDFVLMQTEGTVSSPLTFTRRTSYPLFLEECKTVAFVFVPLKHTSFNFSMSPLFA